jgi:hypothetical protein
MLFLLCQIFGAPRGSNNTTFRGTISWFEVGHKSKTKPESYVSWNQIEDFKTELSWAANIVQSEEINLIYGYHKFKALKALCNTDCIQNYIRYDFNTSTKVSHFKCNDLKSLTNSTPYSIHIYKFYIYNFKKYLTVSLCEGFLLHCFFPLLLVTIIITYLGTSGNSPGNKSVREIIQEIWWLLQAKTPRDSIVYLQASRTISLIPVIKYLGFNTEGKLYYSSLQMRSIFLLEWN